MSSFQGFDDQFESGNSIFQARQIGFVLSVEAHGVHGLIVPHAKAGSNNQLGTGIDTMTTFWAVRHSNGWRIRERDDNGKTGTVHGVPYVSKALCQAEIKRLRALYPPRKRGRRSVASRHVATLPWEQVIQAWLRSKEALASGEHSAKRLRRFVATAAWKTTADATVASWRRLVDEHPTLAGRPTALLKAILNWAALELAQPVDAEMRTLPVAASKEAPYELLTPDQYMAVRTAFADVGALPLFEFLTLYGWRPLSAEKLLIKDYDRTQRTISAKVKGHAERYTIPVHAHLHELLLEAIDDRGPSEPVFRHPTGHGWQQWCSDWVGRVVHRCAPSAGRAYALKRFAITRMSRGWWPWPRPLDLRSIRLFTAHKTDSQAARYLRTNVDEARALIGENVTSPWDEFDLQTLTPKSKKGANSKTGGDVAPDLGPELPPLPTDLQPLRTR